MKMRLWGKKSIGFGCFIIIVFLIIIPIVSDYDMPKAPRANCASNLKQIWLALSQYSADNSDMYPDKDGAEGFELLRKEDYLVDPRLYTCPSSKSVRAAEPGAPLTEENVSFIYIGGFSDGGGEIPIAFDKFGNHKDFVNVLFANGHVEGIYCKFTSYSQIIKMLNERASIKKKKPQRL